LPAKGERSAEAGACARVPSEAVVARLLIIPAVVWQGKEWVRLRVLGDDRPIHAPTRWTFRGDGVREEQSIRLMRARTRAVLMVRPCEAPNELRRSPQCLCGLSCDGGGRGLAARATLAVVRLVRITVLLAAVVVAVAAFALEQPLKARVGYGAADRHGVCGGAAGWSATADCENAAAEAGGPADGAAEVLRRGPGPHPWRRFHP
jgi:hypothetical protein